MDDVSAAVVAERLDEAVAARPVSAAPHHVFLIEGAPGSGKTTLALQFLLAGAGRGERTLYVTLAETRNELVNVADSHGWSLDGIDVLELTPPDEVLQPETQYTVFHPSEVETGQTMRAIYEAAERVRPQRLVLDSLSEMRLITQDLLRLRRQVLALKQFFQGRGCSVLLLDDMRSADHDLQFASIAHGVILLEQLVLEYGAERRRLRVTKMRAQRYRGGYHDFIIRTGGFDVYPRLAAADYPLREGGEPLQSGNARLDRLITHVFGQCHAQGSTAGSVFADGESSWVAQRVAHPVLGSMNAAQWELFHLRHAELHLGFIVPEA